MYYNYFNLSYLVNNDYRFSIFFKKNSKPCKVYTEMSLPK